MKLVRVRSQDCHVLFHQTDGVRDQLTVRVLCSVKWPESDEESEITLTIHQPIGTPYTEEGFELTKREGDGHERFRLMGPGRFRGRGLPPDAGRSSGTEHDLGQLHSRGAQAHQDAPDRR